MRKKKALDLSEEEKMLRAIFGEQADIPPISEQPVVSQEKLAPFKGRLKSVLGTLATRERKVFELRFGLNDSHPKTLEEIAEQFKVTRERIRQIEAKALRKMRHPELIRHLPELQIK